MSDEHYREAGVDLDAAQRSVELIKPLAEQTRRPGVMEGIGGFGALFSLKQAGLLQGEDDLVLVSSTDGVGTKLKLAFELDRHDTIGVDCVAMCVNDIITTGATPLFFLDYLATGALKPTQIEQIVSGIAQGCSLSQCALMGGETAEMPGFYPGGEYDVAGFAVGAAQRSALFSHRGLRQGQIVLGLASSGVHSNGFSLVRKLIKDHELELLAPHPALDPHKSLGEHLLEPTRIYVDAMQWLVDKLDVRRAAHITGGGLIENIPRVLSEGLGVRLEANAWQVPPTLKLLCELGQLPSQTQYRVFNMGIGMVVIVDEAPSPAQLQAFEARFGYALSIIGEVIQGQGVEIV